MIYDVMADADGNSIPPYFFLFCSLLLFDDSMPE